MLPTAGARRWLYYGLAALSNSVQLKLLEQLVSQLRSVSLKPGKSYFNFLLKPVAGVTFRMLFCRQPFCDCPGHVARG